MSISANGTYTTIVIPGLTRYPVNKDRLQADHLIVWIPAPRLRGDKLRRNDGDLLWDTSR